PDSERPAEAGAAVAPRTPVETALTAIWQEVLGLDTVGIYDNFFELGGDSILSIQIIARANAAGWRLTPRQMFLYQTIAEIAEVAEPVSGPAADQGLVIGDVPLTPVQWRFFEQELADRNQYNQAIFLEARERLDAGRLGQAVGQLLRHHDAFRLRFAPDGGGWRQRSVAPEESAPFEQIDLSGVAAEEQDAAVTAAAAAMQHQLDLERGPLLKIALFERGVAPQLVLILVHHMVIDGISWRIVLDDLAALYGGRSLPAKTTSYQTWAQRLADYAVSTELAAELPYWAAQQPAQAGRTPIDRPGGANTEGAVGRVTVRLGADETRALLQQVPAAYRTQINDVLLTALALAYRHWSGQALHVDIEGHGREDIFDGLDISRTVGWFTSVFPALLDLAPGLAAGAALKQVKEQLRRIPQRGIGHGMLRYLGKEAARAALAGAARPEISFNYLGQFAQASQAGVWQPVQRSAGRGRHPDAQRRYLIDIDAAIENDQLEATFSYGPALHDAATIERFGAAFMTSLRMIIEHCASPDAGGCTPSDFPLARISQRQLDALAGNGRALADLYPLAPLQQGMLFQSLYTPGAGVYVEQIAWQVRGALDAAAFQQAWQHVIDQHPILRTSFHWQQLDAPLQAVRHHAPLPFERHDWQSAAPGDWPARLDAFLGADRRRGVDLSTAPLMRVSLIHLAAGAWYLVWSFHHLILDGWSVSMVLNGVMAAYQAIRGDAAPQLARSRPYRDYIEWIARQDQEETARFWRAQLRGVTAPTPLPFEQPGSAADVAYAEQEVRLAPEALAPLRALAQQRHLTLNTLIQGAWAMLLGHYSGRADVVFGSVVSGRPPTLAGVETMVGLFINTLPVRITLHPEQPLATWLGGVQEQQADLRQYEYTPLVQVQGWSEVPRGTPLFENLLAFENYPLEERRDEPDGALEFVYQRFESNLDYPLGLIAVPGNELRLRLWHDARRFPAARITLVLTDLAALLERFAAAPDQALADHLRALPSAGRLGGAAAA
ncbi:MAG TPA: condensation domain-containing protein, partial [Herpetosiphonaceae bacterium]